MSILIGSTRADTTLAGFLTSTTRERLSLQSATQSNLINMSSATSNVVIRMDNFNTGKYNENFQIRQNDTVLAQFSSNLNTLLSATVISNSLSVDSNITLRANLFADSNIYGRGYFGSNLNIISNNPANSGLPIVRIQKASGGDAFTLLADGSLRTQGPLGIGTNVPRENMTLHVENNAYVSRSLYASNIVSNKLQAVLNNNSIDLLDRVVITGNIEAVNDLTVGGNFNFNNNLNVTSAIINDSILTSRLFVNHYTTTAVPVVQFLYAGDIDSGITSNIFEFLIRPEDSNITAMVVDHHGHVGIGTKEPQALFDLAMTTSNQMPNVIKYVGTDVCDTFVMDRNANVGIGTTVPMHMFHAHYCDESAGTSPLMGIYNDDFQDVYHRNFLVAHSNSVPVLTVGEKGGITIGNVATNSNFLLNVAGLGRINCIETQCIQGDPSDCNILFLNSRLSDISRMDAYDVEAFNVTTSNVIADRLFASNLDIVGLGLRCFSSIGSKFVISTSNFIFHGPIAALVPEETDRQVDPISEGKLKIMVQDAPAGKIARGVTVYGNGNAGLYVYSATQIPFLELENPNTSLQIGLSVDNSIFVKHKESDEGSILILQDGSVRLSGVVQSTTTGLGINMNTAVTNSLDVRGVSHLMNFANQPLLYANGGTSLNPTQYVGVATTEPTNTLHVAGTFYVTDAARFEGATRFNDTVGIGTAADPASRSMIYSSPGASETTSLIMNDGLGDTLKIGHLNGTDMIVKRTGFVGINTDSPNFLLDVNGNINFQGGLYYQNSPFITSQWVTNTDTDNIFFESNVGIQTRDPQYSLHIGQGSLYVQSNVWVNSNVIVDGTVYSRGSFVTTSDRAVKIDLTPIPEALTKVSQLTGYTYFRTDLNTRETGLVAQEVQKVLPEAVAQQSPYLNVAYGNMAGLFVEAIKELQTKVEKLEKEVVNLKANVCTCCKD